MKFKEYSPRTSSTSTVAESFQQLLQAYKIKDKFNETNLIASWGKIMGPAIANRTSEVFISRKKLFVTLTSAPLKQELNYNKERVLAIIKDEFGDGVVEDIVIR
ncbi:MAG: DUF721 domain-containing protein [Bacteroidota bacterium]|nr:DUF721 domain-containing protein [Bacteroidota bacterium]